jgi:hypothetical protein
VGADGVIFVLRDEEDFQMRIYNSDGSEPEVSFVFQFCKSIFAWPSIESCGFAEIQDYSFT